MLIIPIQNIRKNLTNHRFISRMQRIRKRIILAVCFLLPSLIFSACLDGRNSVLFDLFSRNEVPFLIDTVQIIANDGEEEDILVGGNSLIDVNVGTINVFTNTGGGNFDLLDTLEFPVESGSPINLDLGDFDSDGDFDLIVVESAFPIKQDVFLNDGLGKFTFEVSFTAN